MGADFSSHAYIEYGSKNENDSELAIQNRCHPYRDWLDRLRNANIILNKEISIPRLPTETQLKAMEYYLLAETRRDRELISYMSDDVTAYLQAAEKTKRVLMF
jgi:hypothetical protein